MHGHSNHFSPFCPTCLGQDDGSRRSFLRSLGLMSALATAPLLKACGGASAAPVEVIGPGASQNTVLIKNAYIATADANSSLLRDGAIFIQNGLIKAVGETSVVTAQYPAADLVIDGAGKLVMPGFVNTHWHATHVFRAEAYDDGLETSNTSSFDRGGVMAGVSDALASLFTLTENLSITPEEAYLCVAAQLLPMLRAGTTTVVEMSGPFGDVLPQVALDLGMRFVPAYSLVDRAMLDGNLAQPIADTDDILTNASNYVTTWKNHPSGLVHPWVVYAYAPMASDRLLTGVKALADTHNICYGGHTAALFNEVAFTQAVDGASPIDRLDRLGLLSSRFMGTHMAWLSDSEITKIKNAGASASLAPAKYAQSGENTISAGAGVKMIRQGINICLGTDGSGWNDSPMPTHMHFSMMYNEAGNDSQVVQALNAFQMGTANGAKAVGLGDKVGSLEVGKIADISIADISDLRYVEASDVMFNFIANAGMKDITTVLVNGRVVVDSGAVKNMSEAEVASKFKAAIRAIRSRIA
jgi:cytosine/adenosine deaminase-related metal-dependent hydrolase